MTHPFRLAGPPAAATVESTTDRLIDRDDRTVGSVCSLRAPGQTWDGGLDLSDASDAMRCDDLHVEGDGKETWLAACRRLAGRKEMTAGLGEAWLSQALVHPSPGYQGGAEGNGSPFLFLFGPPDPSPHS
eukprot:CAMPEP_0195025242 /NCGR_PEP_ID=MMETSP0326_2-20130528/47274_1 /TAXON_ID=2866 ORGANISM="Crypthecodinium cohnii, Strain Seligo" /NCGR_SAMPLE_ID=MMETSP0326_2 /ASSEMBLY_ACC=CAM_ASM_000348 /LENGTH=129 /DNA_ID=CAMNT_0040046499 /DNA_START=312 /DNA_END=699 /DNA_ORIENTATION=-